MVGLERTVVPLLGEEAFGLHAGVAAGAFIVSFSLSKAVLNLFAGVAADRFGRKGVLVAGWIIGLPAPLLLIWAPTRTWVLVANMLLGVNQALTWSMTVNMMVDLMPPARVCGGHQRVFGLSGSESAGFFDGSDRCALRPST